MRRRISYKRLAFLIGLFVLALLPNSGPPAIASPRASGEVVAREVTLDLPALSGTLTRQDGGTIAAADAGSTGGETLLYSSPALEAGQLFDRVGVHWIAAPHKQDSFFIELRTSADGASWSEWQLLTADEDMANFDRNEWFAPPQLAVDSARYAQYRVWLTDGEPASLERVGITFMDVSDLNAGPVARFWNDIVGAARDVARSFTEPAFASAAPVGATRILTRQDWAADENIMRWVPRYPQRVQKAVVHHTVTDDGGNNVAATIRSIYYFHAVTRGWGDIGYSYLVDKYGNVWIGRQGGDATEAGHAYGWNKGTIGIAAIGTFSTTTPTPAMLGAIANVIAMKFTQFGVQPYGADQFTHEEQAPDGSWVKVASSPPNVQGHRDCNYIQSQYGGQTACPGNGLYNQLTNIRQMAQNAVVQGYVQMPYIETTLPRASFPGGNVQVGVTVFNRGKTAIPAGTRVSYRVFQKTTTVVAQGAATPLPANIAPGASATVQVPVTVPAIGSYVVRWDLQTGSTWWGPLYGTPTREQWFNSADWSVDWVSDNVPLNWTAGETKAINVTMTNDGGRVWNASGAGPIRLGYKWVSSATGNTFPGANKVSLPGDVQLGQTITLSMPVTAPVYPTNYRLVIDLYKENEFAFDAKGVAANETTTGVGVDFKAGYTFNTLPQFSAGQTSTVPVTVINRGNGTFPITSGYPVNLAYHWSTPSGSTVVWDGARTKLPADLLSGQSVTVNAAVTAPTTGGQYVLRMDLVQEGVSWFSTKSVSTGNTALAVQGPVQPSFGATYAPGSTSGMARTETTVPVTLTNSSNFTWSAGGANPVRLSYHWSNSAGQTVIWDGLRTPLTADVPPGQSVQLQGRVAFPSTAGTYTIRWDLVQDGVAWFSTKGVPTRNESVAVQPFVTPFFGGSLDVSQTPASMGARLVMPVALRVQNLSNFDWGSNVNLSYHWYDGSGRAVVWDGLRTSVAGIRRNEVRAVTAQIAVPAQAGQYTLRYDIVQEGVTWFSGAGMQTPTRTVTVAVAPLAALYTVPATVSGPAGSTIVVPVQITNAGSTAWQPGPFNLAYHLYASNGAVFVWDGARTGLPGAIGPGQTVTISAGVRVPAAAGTYSIRFDMVQEGVSWFSGQNVPMGSASLQVQ